MNWQANDIAVCVVGMWFDRDGFPLISYPPSGPDTGQMLTVAGIRRHPEYGSIDLRFKDWPQVWFDSSGFRRIAPPVRRAQRQSQAPA